MALLLEGKQVTRRLDEGVVSKHPILDALGRRQMATWFSEKSDHSRKCKKVKMKSLGRENAQTFLVVKWNVTYAIVCVT